MSSEYYTLLSNVIEKLDSVILKVEHLIPLLEEVNEFNKVEYYRGELIKYENERFTNHKKLITKYKFFK